MTPESAPASMASALGRRSRFERTGGSMAGGVDARTAADWPAATLLAAVTNGFSVAREPRLMRQDFEEELRALVNARSVAVREHTRDAVSLPDVLTFEVPSAPWSGPTRLEAVFESAQPIDDWMYRTLSVGAQVAAMLLELEHASGRWVRGKRPDGAAPLIGSSPGIRGVRDRIERVASTDFTVLIEGAIGPQPHCDFVAVFRQATLHDWYGEVAGAGSGPLNAGPSESIVVVFGV